MGLMMGYNVKGGILWQTCVRAWQADICRKEKETEEGRCFTMTSSEN